MVTTFHWLSFAYLDLECALVCPSLLVSYHLDREWLRAHPNLQASWLLGPWSSLAEGSPNRPLAIPTRLSRYQLRPHRCCQVERSKCRSECRRHLCNGFLCWSSGSCLCSWKWREPVRGRKASKKNRKTNQFIFVTPWKSVSLSLCDAISLSSFRWGFSLHNSRSN